MKLQLMFLFTVFAALFFISNVFAQAPATAEWPLTDPDEGGTGLSAVISGQVAAGDELLNNTEINHYSGPNNSQRIRIIGNAWPANQTTQIDSVFIQFAVTAKTGFAFVVDSVKLGIAAVSINTMKANIYYSTDSTFSSAAIINYSTGDSNNYLGRDSLLYVSATAGDTLNPGETFYLRIYPWVDNDPAERTGKYIALQDVKISGDAISLPSPASVTWPLTDPDASGTGLIPVTSGGVKGEAELLNNTEINHYSGPNNSQRVRIAGNEWPANQTTQIDSVFIQFTAAPKFGGTFDVDSISLGIAAVSINTMKANIYYSTDANFTSPVQINYSTGDTANNYLGRDSLLYIGTALNVELNTGESIYLRVYPWVDSDPDIRTGKYLAIQNVTISGTATGVTVDPPTVSTIEVTNIATTFATSGGNIPTDGGSAVTARGVVWDTTTAPTISGNKTVDGTGSGSFVSQITGLTPGTNYYLRAYATNEAGTSYGEEFSFTTLDSTGVPVVQTTGVTNILVKSAKSGGTVTLWGGDTVTVRGVVWNTTGNPSIVDSKTENGNGLGSFESILYPLEANTTYYVRAYASNSKGTGYGEVDTFTTQTPAPEVTKIVAKDGSGDYTTVQAAFDDVPDFYTGPYTIFVKNGTYYEKLILTENKVNVILKGEDRDSTILTYDDYAGIAGGTSMSYSIAIDASDFTAANITFQNTVKNDQSVGSQQAVALRSNGDRQAFYNCNFLGYQDTYYAWGGSGTGRVYMKNCYIEGSVDFIFGRDIVLFDSCTIHVNRNQCSITAASTDSDSKFGFVFKDCIISYDSVGFDANPINVIYLGRAWQGEPRTVFINTYEPDVIDSLGWNQDPINPGIVPALYGVYQNTGPGFNVTGHGQGIGSVLTSTEAAEYTIENIFAKSSNPGFAYDWIPTSPITSIEDDNSLNMAPVNYELFQNYPNPFNPSTIIRFAIPEQSHVVLNIYNVLGQKVATLVDKQMLMGTYEFNFDASNLSSGAYFYNISAGDFNVTKKMLFLK